MSVLRDGIRLFCDFCNDEPFGPYATAKEARKNAKEDGWRHVRGKDMCDSCAETLKASKQ